MPEGARDTFLDLLLEHWPRIAAAAWDGWLVQGRGTVTIEMRPGQDSYTGSERNGFSTYSWGSWDASFVFVTP